MNRFARAVATTTLAALSSLAGCGLFGPRPAPPPQPPPQVALPTLLQQVSAADALAGRRKLFSAGVAVLCRKRADGTVYAILEAAGQSQQVDVPGEADFYSLTGRPDLIVMHDRYCPWMDTIRVFHFSPARVRVRAYPHGRAWADYPTQRYRDFEMHGGQLAVTEELRGGGRSPITRRFAVPLQID